MNCKTEKEREIAEFALALIDEYLPGDGGDWSFTIDRRSRRQHGYCEHNRRTGGGVIGVAAFIIEHASDDEIFDTVTHELAHAICGPDEGHGTLWQNVHKELGGNGERYARAIPGAPRGKYRADCPACGKTGIAYRWRIAPTMKRATHNACGMTVVWYDMETGERRDF